MRRRLPWILAAAAALAVLLVAWEIGGLGEIVAGVFRPDAESSAEDAETAIAAEGLVEDLRRRAVLRGLPGVERGRAGSGRIVGSVALHDPAGPPRALPEVVVEAVAVFEGAPERRETLTDEAGGFSLESIPASAGWAVVVKAAGYREAVLRGIVVAPDRTADLGTILLGAPTSLVGEVVDAGGRPVAGASVQVFRDSRNPEAFDLRRGLFEVEAAADPLAAVEGDRDGRFEVPSIAPGRYVLRVIAPGYAAQFRDGVLVTADERSASVRVVLDPGAGWHGFVLDESGRGIAGARVVAVALPGVGLSRFDRVDTRAGSDGAYRLDSLVPGVRYFVEAWAEGFAPSGRVATPEGTRRLDLTLSRSGVVRGTITDAVTGAGIAGAEVTLLAGTANSLSPVSTVADARGSYLLPAVSAGPLFLFLGKAPCHQTGTMDGRALAGRRVVAGETLVLDLALAPGGVVRGRVTTEGRAVPYATVALSDPRRRWEGEATALTDSRGEYRVEGLRAAEYHLIVSAVGLAPVVEGEGATVTVPEDLREVVKDILLSPGASLHGTVRAPGGTAVAAARLALTAADAGVRARVRDIVAISAGDGTWRMRGVPPGAEVVLEVVHDLHATTAVPGLRLSAGEDRLLDVVMRSGAILPGRAVDVRGRGVEEARVRWGTVGPEDEGRLGDSFRADEVLGTRVLRTDADGRFRIDRLGEGRLVVKIECEGYGDWFRKDLTVAGDGEQPPLTAELTGASRISGRVLDATTSAPIAEAWVYAREERPGPDEPQDPGRVRAVSSNQTGPDGRFVLDRLPPGRFEVVVWLAVGYRAAAQDWRNPSARREGTSAGADGLEFRLEPESLPPR